jgi:hypothetical protein
MTTTQSLINEFFTNVKGNIYTIRYTPMPIDSDRNPPITNCRFQQGVQKLLKDKRLISYILAREKSKKGVLHYHFRFTTASSISVVRKWRSHFLDSSFKGQTYFVLHKCKTGDIIHDDNLWKSATYVCKDGDIIDSHGYTVSQIQDLIAYGNELKTSKSEPIWRRIISKSRLQEGATDEQILDATELFYTSLEKPLPAWTHLKTSLHNMKWTLQSDYRFDQKYKILNNMKKMSEIISNY